MSSLLLDTCAVLWIANGDPIAAEARDLVARSKLHISPITAWEIANLVRKQRILLTMPVTAWFKRATDQMDASLIPLSVDLLVDSCALPGSAPNDPADRIIVATAREYGLVLLTRDAPILDYAAAGYAKAANC